MILEKQFMSINLEKKIFRSKKLQYSYQPSQVHPKVRPEKLQEPQEVDFWLYGPQLASWMLKFMTV